MLYRNNTYGTYKFYGVEFKPGDVKDVPGYITAVGFVRVDAFVLPAKHERDTAEQVATTEVTTDKRRGKKLIKDGED